MGKGSLKWIWDFWEEAGEKDYSIKSHTPYLPGASLSLRKERVALTPWDREEQIPRGEVLVAGAEKKRSGVMERMTVDGGSRKGRAKSLAEKRIGLSAEMS